MTTRSTHSLNVLPFRLFRILAWLLGGSACVLGTVVLIALGLRLHRITTLTNNLGAAVEQRHESILSTMHPTEFIVMLGTVLGLIVVGGTAWLLRSVTAGLQQAYANAVKLSLVASETRNMVILTDANGRIEWVNESFIQRTGYTTDELVGGSADELLMCEPTRATRHTQAASFAHIVRCLDETGTFSEELVRRTKHGSFLQLSRDVHQVRDEHGMLANLVWIEHDITESRRKQESLSFLAAIVQYSDDAIISEDLSGRITSWNTGAQRLLGYTAEEVLGQPISMLAPPDRVDEVPILLRRLLGGEHISHFETVRQTKDGRRINVSLTLSPVRDIGGKVIAFSKIARDITQRKADEAELLEARETAEAASRSKSEFLAHMSHEIRTPLNGVVGMIDLLMNTPPMLGEQQLTYARLARSSGESLAKIVNDILDFSKIEAGKLDIVPEDFHLHTLCNEVVELQRSTAVEKKIEISCQIAENVPDEVCADGYRLRQVLVNLMSNAVKFTSKGAVTLRLSLDSRVGPRAVVRFEVIDTGIGIPPDRLDRLFKAFSQADSSTTRTFGGTGLGLVISKQLVELMGGLIGVTSDAGQGSTFWFTIGLESRALSANMARSSATRHDAAFPLPMHVAALNMSGDREHGERISVLLVEDNEINQIVAREILIKAGFACDVVADGQAALDALRHGAYAAVLMDCEMPVMDGFAATRAIRHHEQLEHLPPVPIIALTANAMKADRQQCLDAGMDAYVSKPINARLLLDTLHKHLREKHRSSHAA